MVAYIYGWAVCAWLSKNALSLKTEKAQEHSP